MDIIFKEIVAIIKEETENINKKIYGTTFLEILKEKILDKQNQISLKNFQIQNSDINLEEKTVELFAENIISAGKSFLSQPMEKPFIPSWQRIEYASPGFVKKLRQAITEDND